MQGLRVVGGHTRAWKCREALRLRCIAGGLRSGKYIFSEKLAAEGLPERRVRCTPVDCTIGRLRIEGAGSASELKHWKMHEGENRRDAS